MGKKLRQKRHTKALKVCLWPPYIHTYTQVYIHVFKKEEEKTATCLY